MGSLEARFAEIEGRRVRYLIGGQGAPLVLCHGFLSSAEEFGGRFVELAQQRTLIVPDLPGNSDSAPLPGRHTAAAMAQTVHGLLGHLQIDRFDLGGLCLGASVACALAQSCGDRIERLLLHTPLIAPRLVRTQYRYQVRVLTQPGLWEGVVWLSRQRAVSDLYKRFVIEGTHVDRQTADVNFENQRRAYPRAAKEWIRDALRRDDVTLLAARINPTLIIVSRQDRLVNVARLHRLLAGMAHVQIFVDEQGGHGWSEGAVRRQIDVLRAFFDSSP
jgi:pimeloyl-ACP methyl ester carboxylesterase